MQPRGVFYIRITAAILLVLLIVGGAYDFARAKSVTITLGNSCLPVTDTSTPNLATVATASALYASGSAGAPYSFTLTYPNTASITDQGYDIWRFAGAQPTSASSPLRDYALYIGHESIKNPQPKTIVTWYPPADFPAGTYMLVPTATDAQTKLLLQGKGLSVTLRSEIPTTTYLAPAAGTSSIASNPGSQAATVLVVGDLVNTASSPHTVKVTWSVTDPTDSSVKAESYYNTVTIPANTPSMEIAHTFNRSSYAEMLVAGAVTDGDVTSTSYFRLTGLQHLHFEYADISVVHTTGLFSDQYTVSGCAAAPPIGYGNLVAQPISVSYRLAGVTVPSTQIGKQQSGKALTITSRRSLFSAPTSLPLTITRANGEAQVLTVPITSAHSYALDRLIIYSISCIALLLLALMPWRRQRKYMPEL